MKKKSIKHNTYIRPWYHISTHMWLCILFLVGISCFLLFSYLQRTPQQKQSINPPPVQAILSMQREQQSTATSGTIDIMLATLSHTVTGAQFTISYDPSIVIDAVTPGSFFSHPIALTKQIDNTNGRLTYTISIAPNSVGTNGSGILAQILFHHNPFSNTTSQVLYFSEEPKITAQGITAPLTTKQTGISL